MSALSYKKMIEKKPWMVSWRNARRRCIDPAHKSYYRYGGLGLQFILTKNECEFLWRRDNAHLLEFPQLDRKNVKQGYSLPNCRFISREENRARQDNRSPNRPKEEKWEE